MRTTIKSMVIMGITLSLLSCNQTSKQSDTNEQNDEQNQKTMVDQVMTAEKQASLTPEDVIADFKSGNERYMNNSLTTRDYASQISKTTGGQYPMAVVLSCIDSRVPVENVFDKGVGDIFVARVAGNFVNEDILGSMEYACKVAGSKLVLVMGHEHCGAVKSAIDDVKLGNITPMLAKIKPAVDQVEYEGEKTSKNNEFVHMVCKSNVKHTIEEIREKSPILKEMEDNGEIKIAGAIYDLDNGQVSFME